MVCFQRGFTQILSVLVLAILLGGIVFAATQIGNTQFKFSKAAEDPIPDADICNAQNQTEQKINESKFQDANFDGSYSSGVPTGWKTFVISGNATFNEETGGEKFDRASMRIAGDGPFVAGVYQTVSGLEVGKWYDAFYATAQKISGESAGALPTIREIGVDLSGGTNPGNVSNWGRRNSGGQPDKDTTRYGGWKTMGNRNNPLVTFKATGSTATIFIRATAQSANSGTSSTWIDSAYFGADCLAGQTTTRNSTSSSTAQTPVANAPTNQAPACDGAQITMSISPVSPKVGETVDLNLTTKTGEGTTKIEDPITGLTCKTNYGLGENFDKPDFWPKSPRLATCTVTALPFTWTHQWKNCTPNDQSCSITPNQCSKKFDSVTGEEKVAPLPTPKPSATTAPASGSTSTGTAQPSNSSTKPTSLAPYGITATGFDQTHLTWMVTKLNDTSNTKFPDLARGAKFSASTGGFPQTNPQQCLIELPNIPDQGAFNLIFTHELGHYIYFCQPDNLSHRSDFDVVYSKEPGVDIYGQTGCGISDAKTEDYAEMIAFYLNQGSKEYATLTGCNKGTTPYANGTSPLHFQLAGKILNK